MHTHDDTKGTYAATVKVAGLTEGIQTQKEVQRATAMLALRTRFQAAAARASEPPKKRIVSTSARKKAGHWPSRMRLEDLALAA